MTLLQQVFSRRSFLKLTTQLSALTMIPLHANARAEATRQMDEQPRGYGIGGYSQGSYPGATNMNYLPLVTKG